MAIALVATVLTTGVSVAGVALNGGLSPAPKDNSPISDSIQQQPGDADQQTPSSPVKPDLTTSDPNSTLKQPQQSTQKRGYSALPVGAKSFIESKTNDCVQEYFGDLDISKKSPTLIAHINTYELSSSGLTGARSPSQAKSCLIVDGNRSDYSLSGNNWKGNFQLLWAFVDGDRGFILFISTDNDRSAEDEEDEDDSEDEGGATEREEDNGEFILSQLIYVLYKKDGKGEVEEPQSDVPFKKVDESNFDSSFLQLGSGISTDFSYPNNLGIVENWGFMKGSGDIDSVCALADDVSCKAMSLKHKFHESGKGDSTGDAPITGGSKNLQQWSNKVNNQGNLEDKLKNFKGTGTRLS